jgi:hypothetical protein
MDNDAKHFRSSDPAFVADRLRELPLTEAEREEALRYIGVGQSAADGLLAASEVFTRIPGASPTDWHFRRSGALPTLTALVAVIVALALTW